MTPTEYEKWREDARQALLNLYTEPQTQQVLHWFDNIKAKKEFDLVGHDEVNAMIIFVQARNNYNAYNSLMARLFIYAPLLLKKWGMLPR